MIDATTMLSSFMKSFPGFELLLNVFVGLVGLVLTGTALFKFAELGKHGSQPGGVTWVTPAMYLISGVALFNFASSVNTFLETFYGDSTSVSNLLGYSGGSDMPQQSKLLIQTLVACLRLYGYFTFARALMSMRRIGSGQSGSDEVFKSTSIRLVAGIGLINLIGTANIVSSTFGFGNVV